MRNPSDTYPYGTVSDSAVENYFRRKVEMTNMYHFMQNYSHPTQNEALHALKEGSVTYITNFTTITTCSVDKKRQYNC